MYCRIIAFESLNVPLFQVEKVPNKSEQEDQKDNLLSSILNSIHCVECNKTFRRQKTYEAHVREVHSSKVELSEFSEPEDLMAGIDVVVDHNTQSSDEDSKAWQVYSCIKICSTCNGFGSFLKFFVRDLPGFMYELCELSLLDLSCN